jgi:biotin transport system substrate-specific component
MTSHATFSPSKTLSYVALFAALIALCSWIAIPTTIPFTMQTFAIFAVLGLLGGRRGTLAILSYLLLGLCGLPVFSGFQAGIGVLLGSTGGYLIGFVIMGLIYWLLTKLFGTKTWIMALSMLLGLVRLSVHDP